MELNIFFTGLRTIYTFSCIKYCTGLNRFAVSLLKIEHVIYYFHVVLRTVLHMLPKGSFHSDSPGIK